MSNSIKVLKCNDLFVAASIDTEESNAHPIYSPCNILFYVEMGQLNMQYREEEHILPRKHFGLVRKYTQADYYKSWNKAEGKALVYAFLFQDAFINKITDSFKITASQALNDNEEVIFPLKPKRSLVEAFQDIIHYIKENDSIDAPVIEAKTEDILKAIIQQKPEYLQLFHQFTRKEKADMEAFMEHNFMYKASLSDFAKMTGRSLSTFNRDFKKIFQMSPHRWIMKRRIHAAKDLMLFTGKKPSQIYLEVGFEDLAHFSKSFKKEFGYSPSQLKQQFS